LEPVIDESRPTRGPKDAEITIVEFGDFQCPYCAQAYDTIKEVMEAYDGDVRLLFKHLPLDFHAHAELLAKFYEAIGLQDPEKAWEFHDVIFEHQDVVSASGEDALWAIAQAPSVDTVFLEATLEPK
jgi:protein-disulfide isomerase